MAWRTYAPDGSMVDVDFTDGTWVATCENGRGVGTSAAEALSQALDGGSGLSHFAGSTTLDAWIHEQAAALERECEAD